MIASTIERLFGGNDDIENLGDIQGVEDTATLKDNGEIEVGLVATTATTDSGGSDEGVGF